MAVLHKAGKKYLDALTAFAAAQTTFAGALRDFSTGDASDPEVAVLRECCRD